MPSQTQHGVQLSAPVASSTTVPVAGLSSSTSTRSVPVANMNNNNSNNNNNNNQQHPMTLGSNDERHFSRPINIAIPNNNRSINLDIDRNSLEKSPGLAIVNSYKERKYKLYKQEQNLPTSLSLENELNINSTNSPRNRSVSIGSPSSSINTSFQLPSSNDIGNVHNVTIDSIHHQPNSNVNNSTKPLINSLSPPSSDLTQMMGKKRSNSFNENNATTTTTTTTILIEDEHGKEDKSRRGSVRHHQREKFQLSGDSLFRKPSPKRSQSEDTKDIEKYYLTPMNDDLSDINHQSMEDSKGHFHVHSLPSRSAANNGSKKTFPTNWIPTNNSTNKFKGIGNPEYTNTANPAHTIKHTFMEFKKNIRDEVKKGVSTVKNAPSFIMSVPKKIIPTYLAQPKAREEMDRMSLDLRDIESFDFENFVPPEQKREAIGELYVTDIQTRNLKSVEGYNTNESVLNTTNTGQTQQKRVKSLQPLDALVNEEDNVENTLFDDYVTYCEILCEGKKHTTMNLGGAYLNKKLKWQEEFKFYISDESSSISIEIFHSPPKPKSKKEIICLGFVSIPLTRVKLNKDRIFDDWFSLITPLGSKTYSQVHLRFQYIPYQNPALSAKDLELLDRMSLNPIIPQATLREKPEHKILLDSLNIDVSDDLFAQRSYQAVDTITSTDTTADISQPILLAQTPRQYSFYDGLLSSGKFEQNSSLQKVKEDLQSTEKSLMNEIHNLKLDLLDTKKRVNDAHEQSRSQMTAKNVTVDKLKNKVEKMESRMNHLSTIVLQLNSAQAITKDKVTSHEEDIKLYESRLKELESKVNSMHSARISTKLKEWVFYLLAFLLFFFSQILVLTGFVFNKIKLRRPPTDEEDKLDDDENEESAFNTLRKSMEGVEKKYRDMAMKTNTPLGNIPPREASSPTDPTESPNSENKETFLSQITKVAVMLPFKKSPLDSPVVERKPTMSFSTLERQNELKNLLSSKEEESSDSEDFRETQAPSTDTVASHHPKIPKTRDFKVPKIDYIPSLNSSSDEDEAKYSVEKMSNRIFEDVSNTGSVQSPILETHKEEIQTQKVIVPEHQKSYLFNQLKQPFNEEEEMKSPLSAETTSPQPFFQEHSSKSQQESIIEEAEKLQTISQFFRKTDSAVLKKRLKRNAPTNTANNESNNNEDDFDSWFNNKVN